jgi:hypothetical protein
MRSKLNDWKNGWFGVELSLKKEEIDRVISLLQMLKQEPDQHFHLSSDGKGSGGVGDIEISVQSHDEPCNMLTMGKAFAPGSSIPDPNQIIPDNSGASPLRV